MDATMYSAGVRFNTSFVLSETLICNKTQILSDLYFCALCHNLLYRPISVTAKYKCFTVL